MMTTPPTYENSTIGQRNYTRDDLEALTNEKAITLIPAMVVLGLMMIAGVVGNTLVCYIFGCRLKSGTQNFLIICLAVLDLLSCVIAIPNEIADMRFYFDFGSAGACKIMRFINTFCSIGSIFTLVVIAIDRYRKICKPFHGQLHMNHVRLSLIPIFGGAIFFAWPAFIMYGLRTTETEIAGLYGKDCSTPDAIGDTIYPLLYNCVLFLCFLILAATLIILYYFVLRETRRHNRYLKRNSDFNLPSSPQYNSEDSHSSVEAAPRNVTPSTAAHSYDEVVKKREVFDYGSSATVHTTIEASLPEIDQTIVSKLVNREHDERNNQIMTVTMLYQTSSNDDDVTVNPTDSYVDFCSPPESTEFQPSSESTDFQPSSESTDFQPSSNSNNLSKRPSLVTSNRIRKSELRTVLFQDNLSTQNQTGLTVTQTGFTDNPAIFKHGRRFKSKTTMIAFLVTLVFIISFLPHLCLQVTKLLNKGFDYHLHGSELVAYNIFLRSYFINSVSNPIIYGVLNIHFSKEVRVLMGRLCRKS